MSENIAYFVVSGQSVATAWFRYPAVIEAFRSEFLRLNPQYSDVQLYDATRSGSAMLRSSAEYNAAMDGVPERANNYWYNDQVPGDGPSLDSVEVRLAEWASGKDVLGIIWDHGHADTGFVADVAGANLYASGLEYVLERLIELSGAPVVYIEGFGDRSGYTERLHRGSDLIRQVQQEFGESHAWAQLATTTFDLPLADSAHLTEAGFVTAATRMALAISTGIASPMIDFATVAADGRIFISIGLGASQGLEAPSELDGFRLFDSAGGLVTIDTMEVDSAAGVVIVSSADFARLGLLQYASATYSFTLDAADLLTSGNLPVHPFNVSLTRTGVSIAADSAGQYRFNGSDYSDFIRGFRSADILIGGAGNDRLDGGGGADRMYGGIGNDIYTVDDMRDFIREDAGQGTDLVNASVSAILRANLERLTLTGTGNINGKGNDLANILTGNGGANRLDGAGGNDKIYGGEGADVLTGGDGNDWLQGGLGRDRMDGGPGADRYVFDDGDFGGATTGTADQIHDFDAAEGDRISLSLVDANILVSGDQAFAWIGTDAFSGTAGELRTLQGSGNTFVQGDTNGDGVADFLIRIDGLHSLGTADVIL